MTKLIAIIKYDCRFNFVYLSIYEYLCIMFEFMFISHSFSLRNSGYTAIAFWGLVLCTILLYYQLRQKVAKKTQSLDLFNSA